MVFRIGLHSAVSQDHQRGSGKPGSSRRGTRLPHLQAGGGIGRQLTWNITATRPSTQLDNLVGARNPDTRSRIEPAGPGMRRTAVPRAEVGGEKGDANEGVR